MKRLACALLTGVLAASTAALPLQAADMEKGITVNCNDGDPGTLDPFAPSTLFLALRTENRPCRRIVAMNDAAEGSTTTAWMSSLPASFSSSA